MKTKICLLSTIFLFLVTGCSTNINTPMLPTVSATIFTAITASQPPTLTATIPSPTPTKELINQVCSPIQGIDISELPQIISNGYISPTPYFESGHPALDFGLYHFKDYSFFPNFPVQSIIAGKAILVQGDIFPYGNMIMTETPLNEITESFLFAIPQPTPLPPTNYSIEERCPVSGPVITWNTEGQSLYVIYAHLLQKPEVEPGDQVTCGQLLGNAGKSGHAAEEHLHLEIRIGPSNASFESIGDYEAQATSAERYNYCIWSLSGVFQSIDPSVLLFP